MRIALPATLATLALLLGGAIVYEAAAPLPPVTVDVREAPRHLAPVAMPAAYAPPPESLFADLDARPPFSAERKPLTDPAQAGGAASAVSDFSLSGVIMGSERAVALLRIKSTSSSTSAVVGDMVNGWRVMRIDPTAVTLRSAGGDAVVALEGPADRAPSTPLQPAPMESAPPPPQPAAAPPPPIAAATPAPAHPTAAPAAAAPRPARSLRDTISKEALKGAPIDPTTGEPTL